MALMEKDKNAVRSSGSARPDQAHDETTAPALPASAEGQDEQVWDAAIANSLDVIREMADRARAERQASSTKRVTL